MGPTNQLHHDLQSEDARPDWMDATGVLNKFWPRETDFSLLMTEEWGFSAVDLQI